MKFLSVFVFLFVVVCYTKAIEITKESVLTAMTACKDEAGATDADLEALKQHQPPANKEAKCMSACVMKKFGLMNEEGKLVRDIAIEVGKAMIKEEDKKDLAATVVDACNGLEVNADHCEAAAQYGACVKEHAKEQGLESQEL